MKRVVSISLGSSTRDKTVELEIMGERVRVERIGCDGDEARARRLFQELDGQVDAFGIGGTDLNVRIDHRYYPLHGAQRLVAGLRTPVVDGDGVRQIVERRLAQRVEEQIGSSIQPKRVMITTAVDRFDMALSFHDAGYAAVYCDLMFALGLPIPVHSLRALRLLAAIFLPPLGYLPLSWVYPTGSKQHQIVPRFERWYQWATVIAGDFNYIKRHLPDRLEGKVVVTNTTTADDADLLRARGVAYLVTSTPRLDGRTFGTNVMEALLTALAGKGRKLTPDELRALMQHVDITPTITKLR